MYLENKNCSICLINKPLSSYNKNPRSRDKHSYRCKECDNKRSKQWASKNKEYRKQYELAYKHKRIRAPDAIKRKKHKDKLKKYNLTEDQYVNLINKAAGKCNICKKQCKLVIDHCHKTNKVRDLICYNCNIVLGHAKDRIETLASAIEYLGSHK